MDWCSHYICIICLWHLFRTNSLSSSFSLEAWICHSCSVYFGHYTWNNWIFWSIDLLSTIWCIVLFTRDKYLFCSRVLAVYLMDSWSHYIYIICFCYLFRFNSLSSSFSLEAWHVTHAQYIFDTTLEIIGNFLVNWSLINYLMYNIIWMRQICIFTCVISQYFLKPKVTKESFLE
jgi:hypothetical protein